MRWRDFFELCGGLAALGATPQRTFADAYPAGPVRIIAGFAAGGSDALPGGPAAFGKLVADETAKWARVVKFAQLKVG